MMVYLASVLTVPWLLIVLGFLFDTVPYIPRATMAAGGIFSITGPWTTEVLRLTNYPNAGEFFSLPVAVVLTMALTGTMAALFVTRGGTHRCLLKLLHLGLVFCWYATALMQLVNCAE